jgi:hypothetical protein
MTIKDKYKEELIKVSHLKNIKQTEFRYSSILLFREYQSRLFSWKYELGFNGKDLFNKKKSFHNIFLDISPAWLNEIITEEKLAIDLELMGVLHTRHTFRDYSVFFLCMYINWELFKDKSEIRIHENLPHPYLPVFKILKRGGNIFNSEGKFEIDNGQTYLQYNNDFELPSMQDDFLDYIDSQVFDFPNQEKVNQLWENFKSGF